MKITLAILFTIALVVPVVLGHSVNRPTFLPAPANLTGDDCFNNTMVNSTRPHHPHRGPIIVVRRDIPPYSPPLPANVLPSDPDVTTTASPATTTSEPAGTTDPSGTTSTPGLTTGAPGTTSAPGVTTTTAAPRQRRDLGDDLKNFFSMTPMNHTAEIDLATNAPNAEASAGNSTVNHTMLGMTHSERYRRSADDQKVKFSKVMKLVEQFKLQDCVSRVICDLNCNPEGFGEDGKKVLNMALQLQTSGSINETEVRTYINAGLTGRKYRQAATCPLCLVTYANCQANSTDLIDVISLIRLDA